MLLLTAVISWGALRYVMPLVMSASGAMAGAGAAPVASSPSFVSVVLFEFVWLVGMTAMMFPAMIPVVTIYHRSMTKVAKRSHASTLGGHFLFLGGYLFMYALLGLGLFALITVASQLGASLSSSAWFSTSVISLVLLLAGIWQFTPMKANSLARCISPIGFFLTHAKDGLSGAFRMGAEHGRYCLGCCWVYMLVMLAVAAMSLPSMLLLSVLIIVEKVFVGDTAWFKKLSAGIFFFLALVAALFPTYLSLL